MKQLMTFEEFKSRCFSNKSKQVALRPGEILLQQNQENHKLFLVLSGRLQGFIPERLERNFPVFEANADQFIGVYSYFSTESKSYTEVRAAEPSLVAYYDRRIGEHEHDELMELMPFMMSIVVNELSTRQQFAGEMAQERQEHLQKLMQSEKMITLGQMAAGLAHELNNSIGVISSNIDQLRNFTESNLAADRSGVNFQFYLKGLEEGQFLSSSQARENRKQLEKKFGVSKNLARKLAKTGISIDTLIKHSGSKGTDLETIYEHWEVGCTLHDMLIASRQAQHVVHSVKQLSVAEHTWSSSVDVNKTLYEALSILRGLTKRVEVEVDLEALVPIKGCPGELVQVWVNLVKNAVESMLVGGKKNPRLIVESNIKGKFIRVNVCDNGPGIPSDIMEKIFEPSFTTKVGGLSFGLGLGLTIVQRIVDGHRGQVNVSSTAATTCFSILLPIS